MGEGGQKVQTLSPGDVIHSMTTIVNNVLYCIFESC